MEDCLKIVNRIFICLLFLLGVAYLVIYIVYMKEFYGSFGLKGYSAFVTYIAIPASVLLPVFASVASISSMLEDDREFLALLANVIFIVSFSCLLAMFIKFSNATASNPNRYREWFYPLRFTLYPFDMASVSTYIASLFVCIASFVTSNRSIPSIICTIISLGLLVLHFSIFRSGAWSSWESHDRDVLLNVILYGNIILPIASISIISQEG